MVLFMFIFWAVFLTQTVPQVILPEYLSLAYDHRLLVPQLNVAYEACRKIERDYLKRVPIATGSSDKYYDRADKPFTDNDRYNMGGVVGNIILEDRTYCLLDRHVTSRRDGHARCVYCWVWSGEAICCMAEDESDLCAVGVVMDKAARAVRRLRVKSYLTKKTTPVPDPSCDNYLKPPSRTAVIKAKKEGNPLAPFKQNPNCTTMLPKPKVPKKLPRNIANQLDAWQYEESRIYKKPRGKTKPLCHEVVPAPKVFRQVAPNMIAANDIDDTVLEYSATEYLELARHYRDQRRRARTWTVLYCSPMFAGDNTPTCLLQPNPADWQQYEEEEDDEPLVSESSGDCAADFSDTDATDVEPGEYAPIAAAMAISPPTTKKIKLEQVDYLEPVPGTSFKPVTPKRSSSTTSSVTAREPMLLGTVTNDPDDTTTAFVPADAIAQGELDTPFEARQLMNNDKHHSYDHLLDFSLRTRSRTVTFPLDEITDLLNARLDEARRYILEHNEMEWPAHSKVLQFETYLHTHFNCAMPTTPGGLTREQLTCFSDYCSPTVLTTPTKITIGEIMAMEEYTHNMLNTTVASMTINQVCTTHNSTVGRPTDMMGRLLTQQLTILSRTRDMAINMLAWCVFARRVAQLQAKHKKTPVNILAKRCTVAWSEKDLIEW